MLASGVLIACGGFLLAVLWFDLMFDVQVLAHRGTELPEAVLASIATYYRRVTTTARPMGHLVAAVMLIALITLGVRWVHTGATWYNVASLCLCAGPIALGLLRTVPNAVRLGARTGSRSEQCALARSICRDHLFCFVGIAAFLALQLLGPP
jgi:hypothetical protein